MADADAIRAAVEAAIGQAADWVESQALAVRSGAGLSVGEADTSFAAQRIIACANGLRAGLFRNDDRGEADRG